MPSCSRCGTPVPAAAPAGECPACLVRLAVSTPTDRPALTVAELQACFAEVEVLELLGTGGMAAVYKVRQPALGRTAAMKVIVPDKAADPEYAERFLREAQAQARLSHPHIVGVYDFGRAGDLVYLLMEYVDGITLRELIRGGRATPAECLRLIGQMCDALQYAHDQRVVHRDVKPENVLVDPAGNVKLADFGLAKVGGGSAFTQPGDRMGTARYMAPEQWADTAGVDHRADIYSLGVLFYELLTGDLPTPQYTPPSAKAGTDRRLDRVVSKSLREEPAERYQRAEQMGSDVERIAGSRPWRWRLPLAAVLALVGVLVVLAWPTGKPPPPAVTPADILTSPEWEWTTPENLGPGANTEHDEGSPTISADGLTLVFHSDRPGGFGGNDVWMCRRGLIAEPFADPVNLGPGVNGPGNDIDPWLSADGRELLFVTQRDGVPSPDIWRARRSDAGEWEPAESLGPGVNTPAAEFRPALTEDGLTLTFTSLRRPRVGQPPRPDIWVCRRTTVAEAFAAPEPISAESHRQNVGVMAFAAGGRVVVCNRKNAAYPGDLLWVGRVESAADPFARLVSFGPAVNGPWIDINPVASADGTAVYFQSDRPGRVGAGDLWVTRRVRKGG